MVDDDLRTTAADPLPSIDEVRRVLGNPEGKAVPRLYAVIESCVPTNDLEAQLDGSKTEGIDCGVASTVMAIEYASGGKIRTTTERVRRAMGEQGPTNPWDWQRAFRAFRVPARKAGLRPLRSTIADGADFARLRTLLFEKRRPVTVAREAITTARPS